MNIIREKTSNDIAKTVTCSTDDDECMMKKCDSCSHKVPQINLFEDSPITYKKWIKIVEQRTISGVIKNISRVVKKDVPTTKKELIEELIDCIPKFLHHKHSWTHQTKTVSQIKNNLTDGEVLIHMDFSENYLCKYGKEIQSVHFGASRQQVTLHTVVTYYKSPATGDIETKSFCSLSESLRHDACAVYAHLKEIFARLLVHTSINSVHILTDSPSTQYRNKSMFYLFSNHMVKDFDLRKASWHFHEASHGKGAPDGIGAYVKRTADRLVAHGKDIQDLETLYRTLTEKNTKVEVFLVTEQEIQDVYQLLPSKLKPIKNTMRVHQVTWDISEPSKIYVRRLSCVSCQKDCVHFGIGSHTYDMEIPAVILQPDFNSEGSLSPDIITSCYPRLRNRRVLYSDDESEEFVEENLSCAKNAPGDDIQQEIPDAEVQNRPEDAVAQSSVNLIGYINEMDDDDDELNIFNFFNFIIFVRQLTVFDLNYVPKLIIKD